MEKRDIRTSAPATMAFVAEGLCWGSFAAQIPVLKEQIGASDSQFGMAMLVASAGAVVAMWLAPLLDRVLAIKALVILALGMSLSFLLPGLTTSVVMFAIFMLMATIFSGALDVIMNARVSSIEAVTGRSLMGYHHGVFSTAYAISAFMTGLARAAGFSSIQIFGGILVIVIACSFVLIKPTPSPKRDQTGQVQTVRLGLVILLVGAVILIAFFAEQATEAWSALHLERSLGAGAIGGALGPTLLGATMAVGRFSGQYFLKFLSPTSIIHAASVTSAVGAFIAAASSSIGVAYFGFIVLGLGVSVIVPMGFAVLGQVVSDGSRTKAIARAAAFGYVGFFIGPPIMGFLSEWRGLSASFTFVGAALLVVPLLVIPLAKRIR